jgi:single-stranded-DNA-specific exonuclease
VDAEALADLGRRLGLPPPVARLLWQRGLTDEARARHFLEPRIDHLRPPAGLPDIDKAARRLVDAVNAGERIAICGDYDVDGMTGTALLVRFFRLLRADVTWAIPDREQDGYGLAPGMVERLAASGARVAITVDNGIAAHAALERARELGLDIVVTDHHLPGPTLPPAVALVNPHLDPDGPPEHRWLCGCALAFKLAWAVADRSRARLGAEGTKQFKVFLRDALALVALATLADQVPLRGENRVLVAGGLTSLRGTTHAGLVALRDVAHLGSAAITTEDVAFKIAPRLNAAGRLSRPELVIELLTCEDAVEARRLARALDDANQERRTIEAAVLDQALAEAEAEIAARDPCALVLAGDAWHIGVVGIVAARLVDRFHRPALVIGMMGDRGRGSGRTPEGIDLHAALTACGETMERFGGHAAAAGMEVARERLGDLKAGFEAAVDAQRRAGAIVAPLTLDATCAADDWCLASVEALRRLEPFGQENPEPVFLLEGAHVAGTPRLLGQPAHHLSFTIRQQSGALRVLGWRRHDLFALASSGQPLDLAVTPVVNVFRGRASAELRLVDARPAARG